ncbi:hypothetical protein E2562_011652 [Oryza meyeriana var. granulata]|uniref:Uncharacterized protein n=1 Tax=Oryza meyeriana var. granulata TaxID=110450 RepID=A0A6G1DGU8_9ORYZ|nr:hypothetical protein E2562_011652 [Oryza meyeriana var. granulata]
MSGLSNAKDSREREERGHHRAIRRRHLQILREQPASALSRDPPLPVYWDSSLALPPRAPAYFEVTPRVPPPPPALGSTAAASERGGGGYSEMAARLLANLIVMGGTVLGRAAVQAYRQAIVNANKTGAAQEAVNGIRRASKAMTEQEARQILGIIE